MLLGHPLSHAFCSVKGLFLTALCIPCLNPGKAPGFGIDIPDGNSLPLPPPFQGFPFKKKKTANPICGQPYKKVPGPQHQWPTKLCFSQTRLEAEAIVSPEWAQGEHSICHSPELGKGRVLWPESRRVPSRSPFPKLQTLDQQEQPFQTLRHWRVQLWKTKLLRPITSPVVLPVPFRVTQNKFSLSSAPSPFVQRFEAGDHMTSSLYPHEASTGALFHLGEPLLSQFHLLPVPWRNPTDRTSTSSRGGAARQDAVPNDQQCYLFSDHVILTLSFLSLL